MKRIKRSVAYKKKFSASKNKDQYSGHVKVLIIKKKRQITQIKLAVDTNRHFIKRRNRQIMNVKVCLFLLIIRNNNLKPQEGRISGKNFKVS